MIKQILQGVLSVAIAWTLTTGAFAQSSSSTTTTEMQTTTTVITTSPAMISLYADVELCADKQAMLEGYAKYDRLVRADLRFMDQVYQFNHPSFDTNAINFEFRALNQREVNGYIAFLSTRLHLDASQEDWVSDVENRMLREVGPLRTAYESRLNLLLAVWQGGSIAVTTTHTDTNVATPPEPEVVAPTVAPEPAAPVPVPEKKIIRNKDIK